MIFEDTKQNTYHLEVYIFDRDSIQKDVFQILLSLLHCSLSMLVKSWAISVTMYQF
jgi:hypothetical protein